MSERTISRDESSRQARPSTAIEPALDQVRNALKGLRFGEVRLIIQDGVLLQIDRVEKQRLR